MNEWIQLLKMAPRAVRYAWMERIVFTRLAKQVRAMREKRGWSQKHLADLMETHQPVIARLETYRGIRCASVNTLKKLAVIFDVALQIAFTSWGEWLCIYITPDGAYVNNGLSSESLAPISFSEEMSLHVPKRESESQ